MAKGVRYLGEFRSPMRGKRAYKVTIFEEGYSGSSILPLKFAGDCVTITYGERDQSEIEPIKSSQAEITILCDIDGHPYAKLYSSDPAKYMVYIDDITDGTTVPIWRGYLSTSVYQQQLGKKPYTLRLVANDGFEILMQKPYINDEGKHYTDIISVSDLIERLVTPLDTIADIDLGYFPAYYRGQQVHTLKDIAIPSASIYAALGQNPTYYDVLVSVLSNFGVQMYQDGRLWKVRRVEALADAVFSDKLSAIALDDPNNGLGVSITSMLSITPPIKDVISERESYADFIPTSLLDTFTWQVGWTPGSTTEPHISKYRGALSIVPGRQGARFQSAVVSVIPGVIKASPQCSITLTFDLYNVRRLNSQVYVDLWLVSSAIGDKSVLSISRTTGTSTTVQVVNYDEDSGFQAIPKKIVQTPSQLKMKLATVDKSAYDRFVQPSLDMLSKSTVTLSLPFIPEISTTDFGTTREWQLAVAFSTASDDSFHFYLANPKMTIQNAASVDKESNAIISKVGVDSVTPQIKWPTAASVVEVFRPSMMSLSLMSPISKYYNASQDSSTIGVFASTLRYLRGKATYVIEGEVDTREAITLSSVLSYDNKCYYPNYVKRLLRREIYDVQMCELPNLESSYTQSSLGFFAKRPETHPIALSSSIYYIAGDILYRYDVNEDRLYEVREAASSTISLGVDCVTFVKHNDAAAICEAYDDRGEVIASLVYTGYDSITVAQWASSVKYDAYSRFWLLTDGVKTVYLYDESGYEIRHYTSSFSVVPLNAEVMPYRDGFVLKYIDQAITGGEGWRSEILVYAFHDALVQDWQGYSSEIVAINSIGYVCKRFNGNSLHLVLYQDSDFVRGISTTFDFASGLDFVGMNCGIVAVSNAKNKVRILDLRAIGSSLRELSNNGQYPTLCGDKVISFGSTANQLFHYADIERIFVKY